ncbi:MAG: hypothetical protein L0Z70_04710 [Chloroflexi bacterium]|nr:hypothetical protein [Chloroflexota bacterium]
MNAKRFIAGVLIALGALLALAGVAAASVDDPPTAPLSALGAITSAHFRVDWAVLASGGGGLSSTHFQADTTLGQPSTGKKSSTHYKECTGFWCEFNRLMFLFLPLIEQS